jgi:hypothetical protein
MRKQPSPLTSPKLKQRFKDFWNNSQTVVWSKVQAGTGAAVVAVGSLHPWISDSTVKSYLDQLHISPQVGMALAGLGLISYICHGHSDA